MEHQNLHYGPGIKSIWKSFASETNFPPLSSEKQTEVVIIGGGITGITTAQLLSEAGMQVVVIEAMKVGGGSTGSSTGNLYVAVEQGFDTIKSKYDTETLLTVVQNRAKAIDLVEENVSRFVIDCDFKRVPWYSYSSNELNAPKIEKEYQAAKVAGLHSIKVQPEELPFPTVAAIKLENQAQFNPLRYVQQLANAIVSDNCTIYENTRAVSVSEEEINVVVETDRGKIYAKHVIHATHTPKGVMLDYHSLLGPYREYGIAAKLASGEYPEGTFWGYYNTNERFSVRTYDHDGEKRIIVVGQPHKVGMKEDNLENIAILENFLMQNFDIAEITNRWGAQNYKPADSLPYIGRKTKDSNIFIATGFSSDGLTYGTMSAIVLRDMLTGIENRATHVFDATRHNPAKAVGKLVKENVSNAYVMIKDRIFFKDSKLADIPVDEGRVVEVDGSKVAVYHDLSGDLKACSAVCTHLGCIVHWNKAEKTWDCPCHASRFATDGCVIEGPALKPLQQIEISMDDLLKD